jgi:hypothetical protein
MNGSPSDGRYPSAKVIGCSPRTALDIAALDMVGTGAVPLAGTGAGNGDFFGKRVVTGRGSARPLAGANLLAACGAVIGDAAGFFATRVVASAVTFAALLAVTFSGTLVDDLAAGLAFATRRLAFSVILAGGVLIAWTGLLGALAEAGLCFLSGVLASILADCLAAPVTAGRAGLLVAWAGRARLTLRPVDFFAAFTEGDARLELVFATGPLPPDLAAWLRRRLSLAISRARDVPMSGVPMLCTSRLRHGPNAKRVLLMMASRFQVKAQRTTPAARPSGSEITFFQIGLCKLTNKIQDCKSIWNNFVRIQEVQRQAGRTARADCGRGAATSKPANQPHCPALSLAVVQGLSPPPRSKIACVNTTRHTPVEYHSVLFDRPAEATRRNPPSGKRRMANMGSSK